LSSLVSELWTWRPVESHCERNAFKEIFQLLTDPALI